MGAFGPAVGACYSILTIEGKRELFVFLRSLLSLRFGWKAWAAIFAVSGLVNLAAWYGPELFGAPRLPMFLPNAFVFPVMWLMMVLVLGGQEEIGWRAYLLGPLEERFGVWAGNLFLGLIWTAWHIPLFFIPGSSQFYMPFAAFAVGMIGESFLFSWVMKISGGRPLSAVVAHGTVNAFVSLFPTIVMEPGVFQIRWWIHMILLLVVGILPMLHHVRRNQ